MSAAAILLAVLSPSTFVGAPLSTGVVAARYQALCAHNGPHGAAFGPQTWRRTGIPRTLRVSPLRAAADEADQMLMLATAALRKGNLVEAQRLVSEARAECEEQSDRLELVDLIQSSIDAASPPGGVSAAREAEPLSSAEVTAVARKASMQAVAAKLASKSGPVAWSPRPDAPEQQAAMEEGDAALSRTVAALSAKEFVQAYEALEKARDAFSRAGDEVSEARSMAVDNLYGCILAERERNVRLQKLIRLKQLLARKRALEDQGAERIAKALGASGDGGAGGAAARSDGS